MINEEKINDVKIVPVKLPSSDNTAIRGGELFDNNLLYNLYIASKKKSGKTSLISNIIKQTTNADTIFYIFCSTHNLDESWKAILHMLDKRGCVVNVYDSIFEGKVNHLNNVIDELMGEMTDNNKEKINGKGKKKAFSAVPQLPMRIFLGSGAVEVVKEEPPPEEKKKKRKTPKYLFVFDDISNQLKSLSVSRFLKVHRHFQASSIISSQYCKDLQPQAITQIDFLIVFKGFSEDKLNFMWKLLDLSIEFSDFLELYYYATKEPYAFLYTNVRTEQFRKSFNTVLNISR